MAVKIRLQRHGKKDAAFFHVVAADGRAPRDGAFIEKLGTYNPNTNPATIDLNFENTLKWFFQDKTRHNERQRSGKDKDNGNREGIGTHIA